MKPPLLSEKPHRPATKAALGKQSVTVRQRGRRLTLAVAATVLAFTPMACGHQPSSQAAAQAPVSHARPDPTALSGSGTFTPPDPASKAITYNPSLAPPDAAVLASVTPSGYYPRTVATLVVAGLLPNRSYAAAAHTNACGTTGQDAGPYYQNRIDPAASPQAASTNPRYANPRNEIWQDIRTDAAGQGTSQTTVPFGFTDRRPGSIELHEATATPTAPGQAGATGAPIACVTLVPSQ
ncbi:MAG: superoxide dismutase [Pseudonocardiaceae bacterium]